MILTGTSKEAFEKWVFCMHHEIRFRSLIKIHNQRDLFISYDDIPGTFLNTLIIEWLDSVGIYVNVSPRYIDHVLKYSVGDFYAVLNFKDGSLTLNACNFNSIEDRIYSRQQSTEKAIEKAIEIYNERGN